MHVHTWVCLQVFWYHDNANLHFALKSCSYEKLVSDINEALSINFPYYFLLFKSLNHVNKKVANTVLTFLRALGSLCDISPLVAAQFTFLAKPNRKVCNVTTF